MTPTQLRLALRAKGYRPVPLIGKRPTLPDWPRTCAAATPETIEAWNPRWANTGILCGEVVGVDIDVTDAVLAEKIQQVAYVILGGTPFVRIGKAPKAMLVYRTDTPIKKLVTKRGAGGQVEVLGVGQQFVAFGIHPVTKQPYTWRGPSPRDATFADLPETNPKKLHAFVEAASELLGVASQPTDRPRAAAGPCRPDEAARLRSALRAIPNNEDYDGWVAMGYAIKHELGEAGRDDWMAWSAQSKIDVPATSAKWWRDFKPNGKATAGSIIYKAKQHGWIDPWSANGRADPPPHDEGERAKNSKPEAEFTKGPKFVPNVVNAVQGIRSLPGLIGLFNFNEMSGAVLLSRSPPTDGQPLPGPYPRIADDAAAVHVLAYLQRHYHARLTKNVVQDAITIIAHEASYHPLRDYFKSLTWDGAPRLDTWLVEAFGLPDTPLWRAVGRAWLIAMVRRVRQPGCKFDNMPVLQGVQNIGKSKALRVLAGGDEFFTDDVPHDLSHKDASDAMRGKWVIEVAELAGFKRSEVETLKAFVSRQVDEFRPAYGHRRVAFPRQSIMCGTTNTDDFLADSTGNRRFWVMPVRKVNIDWIEVNRDHLFAEACEAEEAWEAIYLPDDLEKQMRGEQAHWEVEDRWEPIILEWLEEQQKTEVRIPEILESALLIERGKWKAFDAKDIAAVLRRNGWKRTRPRGLMGERGRVWVKGGGDAT